MITVDDQLTIKHQIQLLVQIVDEWILTHHAFPDELKPKLIGVSQELGEIHTSLEERFVTTLKGNQDGSGISDNSTVHKQSSLSNDGYFVD